MVIQRFLTVIHIQNIIYGTLYTEHYIQNVMYGTLYTELYINSPNTVPSGPLGEVPLRH